MDRSSRGRHARSPWSGGMAAAARHAGRLAVSAGPWHAAGVSAGAVVAGALPVVAAVLTKHIVDTLTGPGAAAGAVALAGALAVTGVAVGMVGHLQRYLSGELGRRIGVRAKGELFAAVNRVHGLARFENPAYLNRIELARQAGDTAPMTMLRCALGMTQATVTAFAFLGTLVLFHPVMAALVVASTGPALWAQLSLSRRRADMMAITTPMYRRHVFFATLLTQLQAAKEIRLFGTGSFLHTRMLDEQRSSNREEARVERHDILVQTWLTMLAAAVAGAALVWAVLAASRGAITVGDVTVLVAAVAGVQAALLSLVDMVADGHESLLIFQSFRAVVSDTPDLAARAPARPAPALRQGIEFDDVWFRYSAGASWTLRGLSLTIPAGRACAVVGVNGSGKSTLVKLLCRFYDPQRGSIRWDGVDLRELDPADFRRRLSVLFQDFMQYDLTALENVALGDLARLGEPDRIAAAARLAGVHDTLVGLPDGYQTPLSRIFAGDGADQQPAGVLLSGGQWQRVALARTLLRTDSDLLVLDEPSSGLDPAAEFEIHARLREHRRGRTSLLISHRLGALRDADTIVVLSGGVVVEQGDHDSLTAARGEYFRLFRLQARGYVPADRGEVAADGVGGIVGSRDGSGGCGAVSPAAGGDHGGRAEHGTVAVSR